MEKCLKFLQNNDPDPILRGLHATSYLLKNNSCDPIMTGVILQYLDTL